MSIYDGTGHYNFYIASFGFQEVIQLILKKCGLGNHIKAIHTGKTIGQEQGIGLDDKNAMLDTLLMGDPRRKEKILLIDDSSGNIIAAREQGYIAYQVNPERAFTIEDALIILNFIKSNRSLTTIVMDADLTLFRSHVTSEWVYDFLESKGVETFGKGVTASQLVRRIEKEMNKRKESLCSLIAIGVMFLIMQLPTLSIRVKRFTPQQIPIYRQQTQQFSKAIRPPQSARATPPPPSPVLLDTRPSYMRQTRASSSTKR